MLVSCGLGDGSKMLGTWLALGIRRASQKRWYSSWVQRDQFQQAEEGDQQQRHRDLEAPGGLVAPVSCKHSGRVREMSAWLTPCSVLASAPISLHPPSLATLSKSVPPLITLFFCFIFSIAHNPAHLYGLCTICFLHQSVSSMRARTLLCKYLANEWIELYCVDYIFGKLWFPW